MPDELEKFVLGDTAISAIEQASSGRRRFFGRRKIQRPAITHCENCGAQLRGHWCAKCGQPAIDYRRSFRHVIADLLNEFLNWDSKFFATIADRKSTRLNSSHRTISYAVFCLKK